MTIGLALSGGGTRAAVFHLGVLRRLAEENLLEQITRLSTVSGGSIVAALIFAHGNLQWPSSNSYLQNLFPALQRLLTTVDLFSVSSVARSPKQWPRVFSSRSRAVANLLEQRWGVRGGLTELPEKPEWLISATCVETAKNWRFSARAMGDWVFGHHYDPPFAISEAAAASAAVPYVIGALELRLPTDGWYSIDPADEKPRERKKPPFTTINLWDGGAYENLGLEPLYKIGRGMIDCDHVVVSDASGPVPPIGGSATLALLRGNLSSPRLFDVTSDQIRSLRSRMFVHALLAKEAQGALIRMGNSVRDIDIKSRRTRPEADYALFQADAQTSLALRHPTNLSSLSPEQFLQVARHGFEVADATLMTYCPTLAPASRRWA